ncbi:MAG: hypothetical protein R3358_09390 [Woeseiaceae bacterium]|nr:hypothetical protein [Woeseiaceae bacterium]
MTTSSNTPRSWLLALALLPLAATAQQGSVELGGHTKLRLTGQRWPDDSLFRDLLGSASTDWAGDLRLNLEWRSAGWSFDANWQLIGLHGDTLALSSGLPSNPVVAGARLPDDDRRLFDLTDVISDGADSALLHRLDRLFVGYASDKTVIRFGRQALSWGNGLFYAPMDLVNPFDPATIDTEFKTGDDMLYGQYLFDSGNDVQAAAVFRRNLQSGDLDEDASTLAVKYHGFASEFELDLLVARSYGDTVIGLGGSRDVGGAVWRADLVVTDAASDTFAEFVTNASYSWAWGGRNMTGSVEYYFNGAGQPAGDYDPSSLAGNPVLLARLARGQSFTLGRHYVAANVMIEMTPLWNLSPVLLINAADPSALLQLVTTYSASDNILLTGSINLPLGAPGTEFGGIESGVPGRRLSFGAGVFAQFAWYF